MSSTASVGKSTINEAMLALGSNVRALARARRGEVASAVRRVIAVLEELPAEIRASASTRARYLKAYRALRKVGRTPDHYCEVKRTFYFYRAAWIYGVAQELAQSIEEFAHAHDAVDGEAVKEMTDRLLALSVDMMRHAPGVAGGQGRPGDEAQSEGDFARLRGGKRAVPAKSKRSGLGKLPDDWREQVIDASKSASCTFWPAIAVLAATGCRSAEIGLGVRVFVQDEHGLRILIPGAKVRAGIAGQPLRELLFPNAGEVPGGSELQSLARAHGGRVDIRTPSVQALRNAVRTFGAPVGADHDYKISTMSFRHAFASDAKCSGEREGLPAAMGQRSDRTMRTYGTAAHGRRRLKFISSATHEVKRTAGNALPKTRKGPMPS